MGWPLHLRWLVATALLLAGCSTSALNTNGNDALQATFERLELRVNQFEQQLNDFKGAPAPADSKTPAGPIRSLTLRLGTDDDRLRLYWGDGQPVTWPAARKAKELGLAGKAEISLTSGVLLAAATIGAPSPIPPSSLMKTRCAFRHKRLH